MPTDIVLTPEQEKLKTVMVLKYGDLTDLFWTIRQSRPKLIPAENRVLEHHIMTTTQNTNVRILD